MADSRVHVSEEIRGRAAAADADKSSSEDEADTGFSDSVPGLFRGKVLDGYSNASQPAPQAPLYEVNEVVYIGIPGQQAASGPYVVTAVSATGMYRLKRKDNNAPFAQEVSEASLVVPA